MKENRIVFLSVPESLGQLAENSNMGGFSINPEIPVPVEIPEGLDKISIEDLSWEMILAGMLRVIEAGEEKPEWIDYYRSFVLVFRPGILEEFSEAAIIKARNGDCIKALEILDTLRGLFPVGLYLAVDLNRALVLEQCAAQMQRQGKPEAEAAYFAAQKAYLDLMELEPPLPDAYYNGGYFFLSQKNFLQAAECFSRYIEIAQDDEKRKQAKSILKEIRDKGLDNESFIEAYALIQQGKAAEALPPIHDFLEQQPTVWNGWFLLGWALRLLGRFADGEAAFRKTIELGGANSDTRNELAICLMENGNYPGARKELETALWEDPENVKIISNLGVLAIKTNRKNEATAFFRTVLELSGNDPIAKKYLEEMENNN
jgi:Flp pilus assembly protein TadD